LAEVARRREEAALKLDLDAVSGQPLKPIKGATNESLREASAGYPQSLAEQAKKWQHEAKRPPVALSEYWRKQFQKNPSLYTQQYPELPPDLSAFEEDHYEGNTELSEYFGPFRIDYATHVIELDGWNFVVSSPGAKPGLGNLVVGHGNFYTDATNSFICGFHNTARGDGTSSIGGADNEAQGVGDVTIGGEDNMATGSYSAVDGGYRNEATGFFDTATGGNQNTATGNFAVASGGQNNYAEGTASSITGGRGNEALGVLTSIHGGAGNQAKARESTIVGGVGFESMTEAESMYHQLDGQDIEAVASADFSKSKHSKAAWTQSLDMDYLS
jgi:hypothetical protein